MANESGPAVETTRPLHVGRRVFLGMSALGALGIAFGSKVQSFIGSHASSGVASFIPGGDRFRIYTITDNYPVITPADFRLQVTGLVDTPMTLTLDDLHAMPATRLTKDFQCVTGWRVANVEWEGVLLRDILDRVGVRPGAKALAFTSYDGADTESLTLDQARRSDVLVAYRMLGAPVTTEHGGPVRLYVAPMYGYKSAKWLKSISLVEQATPGFWEQQGYDVEAWIGSSNGRHDAPVA